MRAALSDDIVRDAIARAVALRRERQGTALKRGPAVARELQAVEQRITRILDAIATGGPVEELVDRLKAERARKTTLADEQRTLDTRISEDGAAEIRTRLMERVADLRRLLGAHVGRTRQLLTAMLSGPVAMAPVVEGGLRGYRFKGRLRLGGLLLGDVLETRQPVVAPTGFDRMTCSAEVTFEGAAFAA